jgi:hypothetical protein
MHIRPANRLSQYRGFRRRGILTAWSCIALVTVGLCAAVAINRNLMSNAWSETQYCADAAALAGCRQLLNDDLLRETKQIQNTNSHASKCRNKAMEIGRLYGKNPSVPSLYAENIEVYQRQWNTNREVFVPLTASIYPNAVKVRLSNHNSSGLSGKMIGSTISGIGRITISCESTAIMHDRIIGFRSGPGIPIPLIPLAIPESSKQVIPGTWSSIDDQDSSDEYWWDDESNELFHQADGIAELAVTIRPGSSTLSPGRLLPVEILRTENSASVADRCRYGISHADTTEAGLNRLSFPRSDLPHELTDAELDELDGVFSSLIGKKRIFPLADLDHTSSELMLADVVAARILIVARSDNELHILLQPTVMSTPAAIVSRSQAAQPNRYIRRITLLR